MAASSRAHSSLHKRPALISRWYLKICYPKLDWLLRKDLLANLVLLLIGFGLPCLMVFELLPVNLWLAFLGLALVAVGGGLTFVRCGEI